MLLQQTLVFVVFSSCQVLSHCWVVGNLRLETGPQFKLRSIHLPIDVPSCFEAAGDYSDVIDVRSPSEFAKDHFPGAINLPVLNDEERHIIGCMYRDDPFLAKKKGAALVARNIALHLENHFSNKSGDYKPLLYCWRGGARSSSMALTLSQVGWRVGLLNGGYKSFRREVRSLNDRLPLLLQFRVLAGLTGVGKTALLLHLRDDHGHQVIDLEGLANHRGSALGSSGLGAQPSQKLFESRLASKLSECDPARPVWIEAESAKVGNLQVPSSLWKSMRGAPRLMVTLPVAVRVERILDDYRHWVENPRELKTALERLRLQHGSQTFDRWTSLIDAGRWHELVESLLLEHYDALYSHKEAEITSMNVENIDLLDFSPAQLALFVEAADLATMEGGGS